MSPCCWRIGVVAFLVPLAAFADQGPPAPKTDAYGDPLPPGAVARLAPPEYRHGGKRLLGFSADGKALLFHSAGLLHWMDADTGKWIKSMPYRRRDHGGQGPYHYHDPVLLGNGSTVVFTDWWAPALVFFDLALLKEVHRIPRPKEWLQVKLTADGKHLVALTMDRRLLVVDATAGVILRTIPIVIPPRGVFHFLPTADARALIAWTTSDTQRGEVPVKLYDLTAPGGLVEIRALGEAGRADAVALSSDGAELFLHSGTQIRRCNLDTRRANGSYDVTIGTFHRFWGHLRLWETKRDVLAVSPGGKQLALAGIHVVALWDVTSGQRRNPLPLGGPVTAVQFSPAGPLLAVTTLDGPCSLWDPTNARPLRKLEQAATVREDDLVDSSPLNQVFGSRLAFSGDGKLLAVGSAPMGVAVWDVAAGKHLYEVGATRSFFFVASPWAFNPNIPFLAVAKHSSVDIIDARTEKLTSTPEWPIPLTKRLGGPGGGGSMQLPLAPPHGGVRALAYSPDGRTLAGVGPVSRLEGWGLDLVFWEASTEQVRLRKFLRIERRDFGALSLVFSPDCKRLALGTLDALYLINTATGDKVLGFARCRCAGCTATFSADGKLLFAGSPVNGMIIVLDAASGDVVWDLPAHTEPVWALSLSSDGKKLASGSRDGTVLLWEVAELLHFSPEELANLWEDLAGTASAPRQAMGRLSLAPSDAVPFLKSKLGPIPPMDPQQIGRLVAELDSPKFAVRDKATRELEKAGFLARPELEKQLALRPSLEMRHRIDHLLAKLDNRAPPPDLLRQLRAVEALERMATPGALALLQTLAGGAAGHPLTEDARAAVQRLTAK
jgi:WD40 repeat protein